MHTTEVWVAPVRFPSCQPPRLPDKQANITSSRRDFFNVIRIIVSV